jgi:uncharacterized DUF497 family protein
MCDNNNVKNESEIIIEWDEPKRQETFTKHGVDFADSVNVLSDPNVAIEKDNRRDYGEVRFNAWGISRGRRLRVCFTIRGEAYRIITMFKVHEKEWSKHYVDN